MSLGKAATISGISRRSSTPRVNFTPPPPQREEEPQERAEPLYDLRDVKSALDELEHLKKNQNLSQDHEMRTAPLIMREAYIAGGFCKVSTPYGVIGETLSIYSKSGVYEPVDPRLYINTNTPFSAVVSGVQGSGKSHTMSVLLENMFIPQLNSIGKLLKPLVGLVLHFGEGGPSSRPCEAAWVGTPSSSHPNIKTPSVCVYVSKSSLNTMKAVYEPLGSHVKVIPLVLNESELDAQAFLSMMAVGSSESAPLYIQTILSILRELGESFSYRGFLRKLDDRAFNQAQTAGLEQRLSLLNSFMDVSGCPSQRSSRFATGELTIVDLSDPFIDPGSACGLFEIVVRMFVRAEVGTGKVLVVDEAHKYLSQNRGVTGLTKSLLTLTREQRHLAMGAHKHSRTYGYPSCVVGPLHGFYHAPILLTCVVGPSCPPHIVGSQVAGEALVLAPSGMGVFPDDSVTGEKQTEPGAKKLLTLSQFGRRLILMKTRARVTKDGGASVLVVDPDSESKSEDEGQSRDSNTSDERPRMIAKLPRRGLH